MAPPAHTPVDCAVDSDAIPVSGQFVATKSSRLPHVAGCDEAFVVAAGAAFVAMRSSADASGARAAPASPSIKAAETPKGFIFAPPGSNLTQKRELNRGASDCSPL